VLCIGSTVAPLRYEYGFLRSLIIVFRESLEPGAGLEKKIVQMPYLIFLYLSIVKLLKNVS